MEAGGSNADGCLDQTQNKDTLQLKYLDMLPITQHRWTEFLT